MAMFGAVCSGRPIQLAQQVEPTKFVIAIPNAAKVNHMAIFLLPQTDFTDPNFTALVYFQLPNLAEFKLLGGLSPLKPSAIFKLNTGAPPISNHMDEDDLMNDGEIGEGLVLNVGISIEPTAQAQALLEQEKLKQRTIMPTPASASPAVPAPLAPLDIAALANKIVMHAYNYLGSFVDAQGKVPMKQFDTWWLKFKAKLANNPNFLNELD
ncbi:hypothetical protein PUMCH_003500 [Australozyma saopauloensis]|uniref:Hikeshi-like domain-containing protein n=1 Tax=Australozyma saopauloensis TaxID=291208 RepID=A0AAX4HCZ7_9ASCO|nr:hypothetical protein PUMCH_003500 [[Candida] saopauloensis]